MKIIFVGLAQITNAFPYYCLFTNVLYDINYLLNECNRATNYLNPPVSSSQKGSLIYRTIQQILSNTFHFPPPGVVTSFVLQIVTSVRSRADITTALSFEFSQLSLVIRISLKHVIYCGTINMKWRTS